MSILVEFAEYSDKLYREQFYELNIEYVSWVSEKYDKIHNIDLESVNGKSNEMYVKEFLEEFTKIKPPRGIILVLLANKKVVGMGAVSEHGSGVGEIKRMFIKPEFRGQGLGRTMFSKLIEKGREFGFSKLRLETANFFEAARHLYRSFGFQDIEEYHGGEVSLCLRETTKYMEMEHFSW